MQNIFTLLLCKTAKNVERFITHLFSHCSRCLCGCGLRKLSINLETLDDTSNKSLKNGL